VIIGPEFRPAIFCLLRHSQPHCHSYATGLGILSGHRADIVDRSKMTHDRRAAGHSTRSRTIRGRQSGGLQHLATAHKLLGCPFNGIGSNARQYLIHHRDKGFVGLRRSPILRLFHTIEHRHDNSLRRAPIKGNCVSTANDVVASERLERWLNKRGIVLQKGVHLIVCHVDFSDDVIACACSPWTANAPIATPASKASPGARSRFIVLSLDCLKGSKRDWLPLSGPGGISSLALVVAPAGAWPEEPVERCRTRR